MSIRRRGKHQKAGSVLGRRAMVRKVTVVFILWDMYYTLKIHLLLTNFLEQNVQGSNNVVDGMFFQIFTSIEDSHPRTEYTTERKVCHLRILTPHVQGVCMPIIVWDYIIEGADRAQQHRLRDQRTLQFASMATTTQGSGREDQKINGSR